MIPGAPSAAGSNDPTLPERIELRGRGRELHLRWSDCHQAVLSAAALRNACRCAACTHSRRSGAPLLTDAQISLLQVREFGVAGLQLVFSDGHQRGIYPWRYLRQLATGAD